MELRGRAWLFGDDIDTDQIYPGKYLPLTDKHEMAKHAMAGTEQGSEFIKGVKRHDIIIAGKNFGCGSSREHASVAIKGVGVDVVIARSFARIFRRNATNTGLAIVEMDDPSRINKGDDIAVDTITGVIINHSQNEKYQGHPVSILEQEIMQTGGLLEYLKKMNRARTDE